MRILLRVWLNPRRPTGVIVTDPRERTVIKIELVVVFAVTLGLRALGSMLSLADDWLRPGPLRDQAAELNRPVAKVELIDLLGQLLGVVQKAAWAALGLYLLWRAGVALAKVGFGRRVRLSDVTWGAGLAALIGVPGLILYLAALHAGVNLEVVPSSLTDTWWRPIVLTLSAVANGVAEEVLIVAYLLTRLRHLGVGENTALLISALLRGAYHLYQGLGGFAGNVVMGLIFGRVWQRTNRLWPLVIAHALIDIVAFVGYTLLRDSVSWLP